MTKMNNLKSKLLLTVLLFGAILTSPAQTSEKNPGIKVKIITTKGNIIIKLYNETPLHQANFVKLVNEKYYNGTLFHRVIKDFMVQAGDPDSRTATPGQALGNGGPSYTINPEFKSNLYHKKGALSAARAGDNVNPEKKSSGSQFYIVQGKIYKEEELVKLEKDMNQAQLLPLIRDYIQQPENAAILAKMKAKQQSNDKAGMDSILTSLSSVMRSKHPELKKMKYSEEQKKVYKTAGGTPFLDMNYTVFGEVLEGFSIVEMIAVSKTDSHDRPLEDIKIISMEIVK
jgi:peptidylprolyl isomerase